MAEERGEPAADLTSPEGLKTRGPQARTPPARLASGFKPLLQLNVLERIRLSPIFRPRLPRHPRRHPEPS